MIVKFSVLLWLQEGRQSIDLNMNDAIIKIAGGKAKSRLTVLVGKLEEEISNVIKEFFIVIPQLSDRVKVASELIAILQNEESVFSLFRSYSKKPIIFSKNLKKIRPVSRDDNDDFDFVLNNLAELMTDLKESLPFWEEDSIERILKDEVKFLEISRQLIEDRLQSILRSDGGEDKVLEDQFRRAAIRFFDSLHIVGLNVSGSALKYTLSVAYITLQAELNDLKQAIDGGSQSIEEVLSMYDNLVIQGNAGQGKTTLLQWIVVTCCRKNFQGSLSEWNSKIPFFIRLRDFAEGELPMLEQLPAYMTEIPHQVNHKDWVNKIFENRRAIMLVDGYDEISTLRRRQVVQWLENIESFQEIHSFLLPVRLQ